MKNPFRNESKFLIEGSQQDLENLHKALASVISSHTTAQAQVICDTFNVIFRKRVESDNVQGALDEVDDGN